MKQIGNRAFLKWAGGKYSLINDIQSHLPVASTLVEPFVGAGSVFLNTQYKSYQLNDINADLINLYNIVKREPASIIGDIRQMMVPENNEPERYYDIRSKFNLSQDVYERSVFFVYLNRHGYNGLCRYNRKGGYNVPFGRYRRPYFPEKELWYFSEKAQCATFTCLKFEEVFANIPTDSVVYCDPPYAPISDTAKFTDYSGLGFNLDDQRRLAVLAQTTAQQGIPVLLSNHDTGLTRSLYQGAEMSYLNVSRTISRNGQQRRKVGELLALYQKN